MLSGTSRACPFCPKVSWTLAERMADADAAVIVRLVKKAALREPTDTGGDAIGEALQEAKSTFAVVRTLKGASLVGDARQLRILYLGEATAGATMLALGAEADGFAWRSALEIGDDGPAYLDRIDRLPKKGPDRLAYFQDYLVHKNPAFAEDAFGEFSKASYEDVLGLKDRIKRDRLRAWIDDPETTTTRRRLYFLLLGICGTEDDVARLEGLLTAKDPEKRRGLDSMIACYLSLKGAAGLPLIEDRFLKHEMIDGKRVEYTETYAAIQALRFHGEQAKIVPRKRLLVSLRYVLDRPLLADLVIPDLARWEDWSVLERLTTLFRQSSDETAWVRVPVIKYLMACPLPEAQERIADLKKIDPEAVQRAGITFPQTPLGPAKTPPEKTRPTEPDR